MPPSALAAALLAICGTIGLSSQQLAPPRASCRRHYLAGVSESGILPLQFNDGPLSNIECKMPAKDGSPFVTTVIHSGLHNTYRVIEKKTVGFQIRDLDLLQMIIRTHQCSQTVTIRWEEVQAPGVSLTLSTVLGIQMLIPGSEVQTLVLEGTEAGVLHIFPSIEHGSNAPFIEATELTCTQAVNTQDDCLIDGEIEVSFKPGDHYFEFAFRTDRTDQGLFDIYMTEDLVSHVRLEKDFYLRVDAADKHNVGLLADGRWHTVKFRLSTMSIEIDNQPPIPSRTHIAEVKVKKIGIKIEGQVILTHPLDEAQACAPGGRREFQGLRNWSSRQFCWDAAGCGCHVLTNLFESLPSSACIHKPREEENAYHLLRTPDILSFLYLNDVLSPVSIRTAMTFKSDADSGLLMFGSWREDDEWGRFQVHYYDERITAMYCTQNDESTEICSACAIYRVGGFATDQWSRVAFYKDLDAYHMMVDTQICELHPLREETEFDTAEMYKTILTRGSVLFIGGMFHKKVKPGIYKEDFKQKYFENTREKLPSLRGCVKDVFANGHRINMNVEFEQQMLKTLVNPQRKAYALVRGCGHCAGGCESGSRCRPSTNLRDPEFKCDCADVLKYSDTGFCRKPTEGVLSLSSASLNAYRGLLVVPRNKGILNRIWLKLRMPRIDIKDNTPLVHFYSHGKIMFRIFVDIFLNLHIQVNPEDPNVYTSNAGKSIDRGDDRIHLIKFERRTPMGTHPSRRFYNVLIDGYKGIVPDPDLTLTGVEFSLVDVAVDRDAGCVTDFGIAYDYEEHTGGTIEQLDLKQLMMMELGLSNHNETCGVEDPLLWVPSSQPGFEPSPFGRLFEYTPSGRPESAQLLSNNWLVYSIILTVLLVLFILILLCFYCCVLRNRPKSIDDDKEHIVRRRSDEYPVILRRPTGDRESCISDSLDQSDIRAYDDIRTHKVKIDRESMISFLDPVSDEGQVGQASIVRRQPDENAPLVILQEVDQ